MTHSDPSGALLGTPQERVRLVDLCRRLTHQSDDAEDLAQETLLIAWQKEPTLRNPTRREQWLAGIAQNLCLHWFRTQRRDLRQEAVPIRGSSAAADHMMGAVPDDIDLEAELEKAELTGILDRAMSHLPPLTQSVLIERFVNETPQADVAYRLGMTEGAVEARIQRGKRALGHLLLSEFRDEAAAYGITPSLDDNRWQETRIWCPLCGKRRLEGRFTESHRRLTLRCPNCLPGPDYMLCDTIDEGFGDVRGYRTALSRLLTWAHRHLVEHLRERAVPCPDCRRSLPVEVSQFAGAGATLDGRSRLLTACPACDLRSDMLHASIALCLPEGQRFWRDHPRIVAQPEWRIEVEGEPTLVVGFQDATGHARLDALLSLTTLRVTRVHVHSQ